MKAVSGSSSSFLMIENFLRRLWFLIYDSESLSAIAEMLSYYFYMISFSVTLMGSSSIVSGYEMTSLSNSCILY